MTATNSGAVFFLGTRAHYQVLQQPETDGNGNSTESIYQNSSQELWRQSPKLDDSGNYEWSYCDSEVSVTDEKMKIEVGTGVKRRHNRRSSEITLCERDSDIKPALLNNIEECETPKSKSRQRALLRFLSSLARRRRMSSQYTQQLELSNELSCSYKESCRCLDCQSRYFECDDSDEYSSDDSEYLRYVAHAQDVYEEDDDEVFTTIPSDATSADLLLQPQGQGEGQKLSTSSEEEAMELEVAAGTPVLLNYLLTHPITCAIQ